MDSTGRGNRQRLLKKLGEGKERRVEGEEENMEWDAQERGRTARKRKERDTLIDRAIKGLSRNMTLEIFSGIHKDNPS